MSETVQSSSSPAPTTVIRTADTGFSKGTSRTPLQALRRLLAFFVILAGAIFATHLAIDHGLRRIETSAFGITNKFMSGMSDAQILISGSSRALNHYDPAVIQEVTGKRTFNIGRNGSQTDLQLAVLRAYLARNPKPELIIHNLDSFSFVTSKEIYDPAQYMPHLHDEHIYAAVREIYPDAWRWRYVPLYPYVVHDMRFSWLTGIMRWLGRQPREDHQNGFQPRYTQWTGDFESFRAANPDGVEFDIEEKGIDDLEGIAAVCQEYGVPLVFVYSPVYHEMQSLERNRDALFEQFRSISRASGAVFFDFSNSPISADRSSFYNSQHLNATGAQAFSTELAHKLTHSNFNQGK